MNMGSGYIHINTPDGARMLSVFNSDQRTVAALGAPVGNGSQQQAVWQMTDLTDAKAAKPLGHAIILNDGSTYVKHKLLGDEHNLEVSCLHQAAKFWFSMQTAESLLRK